MEEMGFDYHSRCRQLSITHVTFAYDLFLLAGATKLSFEVMRKTPDDFGEMSGLWPNLRKNNVFLTGVLLRKMNNCAISCKRQKKNY